MEVEAVIQVVGRQEAQGLKGEARAEAGGGEATPTRFLQVPLSLLCCAHPLRSATHADKR